MALYNDYYAEGMKNFLEKRRQDKMDQINLNLAMEDFFETYFLFEEAAILKDFIDGEDEQLFDVLADPEADDDELDIIFLDEDDFFITDDGYEELSALVVDLEELVAQKIDAVKELFKVS